MTDASLGTAVLRTKLDSTGLKTGLNAAKGETQKFAADSTSAIKGIGAAFGAIAASQGLRSYITFMRSAASEAHQATTATQLYEKALKRNNLSVDEGRRLVERLADKFGVVNSVVEESATFLLRQGASLDTVEKALTTAGASAAAAGFDISTAFNNVSTAVATGNSALLKTSGIVTTLGAAEQSYARSIGKTVEALTQEERIMARVNAIYAETASEIEDIDILLQGLPKSQANVTKELTTFRQTAGDLALKVLVPINEGIATGLRLFNSLPEPVKQAGIAMVGAGTGATALAAGFVAIKTALAGMSGLGLLSFGPAGWIVAGVTVVAGLVAVLAGSGADTLEGAVKRASSALASGDANSLTGALDAVIAKADVDTREALTRLREDLIQTGDVGVEQAERILYALSQAKLDQAPGRTRASLGLFTSENELRQGFQIAASRGVVDPEARVRAALEAGNRIGALQAISEVVAVLSEMDLKGQVRPQIVEAAMAFWDEVFAIPADAQAAVAAFNAPATTVPAASLAGGAGGGAAPAGTESDPVTVRISERHGRIAGIGDPSLAGVGPVTQVKTEEQLLLEGVERQTRINMLLEQMEINAGQAADVMAIYADTQQAMREAEQRNLSAALDVWGDLQRAGIAEATSFARTGRRYDLDPGASLTPARDLVSPEVTATLNRAAVDLTGSLEGITAELGSLTEGSVNTLRGRIHALREAADGADPEVRAGLVALVQMLETELADLIRRTTPVALGITPTVSIRPISIGQEAFNAGYQGFRNRDLDRGDGGLAEARRINQEREASADRFANTVVSAGFAMGDAAIKAIADGDIPGLLRAGLSGAGSILGSANLGSIPFLGGSIGIGGLIAGGLGLLGTLIGALSGGGGRDQAREAREAAARTHSVSALEFNFFFNQTNTFTGELQQARNQQALREAGLVSFRDLEQLLRRTVLPKLDGLEARVAALSG